VVLLCQCNVVVDPFFLLLLLLFWQGFTTPMAGIESVFGTLMDYFDSQPIANIMYVEDNTVYLRTNLEPGDIEFNINSI
jgi:hypothetical protein